VSVATGGSGVDRATSIERERKYLVAEMPPLPPSGDSLRQGYVATDGEVAVRVRESNAEHRTLTIKGGRGAVRTELEWPITREQFDALWALTDGRRIEKTRYRLPLGEHVAELDVFAGTLAGLVLVEVEFDSDAAMARFEPPRWFGDDVTDDRRYTNAALALDGAPPLH
jgi:adenylate cyclase